MNDGLAEHVTSGIEPEGALTVTATGEAISVPIVASIFTVPPPIAVAWPPLLILATEWSLVFHNVTALPCASGSGPTEPSEYLPYAVNCSVPPVTMLFSPLLATRYALTRVGAVIALAGATALRS